MPERVVYRKATISSRSRSSSTPPRRRKERDGWHPRSHVIGGDCVARPPRRTCSTAACKWRFAPSHRFPAVTHVVWCKIGGRRRSPRGNPASRIFLEHLTFKSTLTTPPGGFTALIARNRGRDDASTTQGFTGSYEAVARDNLALVMWLETDLNDGPGASGNVARAGVSCSTSAALGSKTCPRRAGPAPLILSSQSRVRGSLHIVQISLL